MHNTHGRLDLANVSPHLFEKDKVTSVVTECVCLTATSRVLLTHFHQGQDRFPNDCDGCVSLPHQESLRFVFFQQLRHDRIRIC